MGLRPGHAQSCCLPRQLRPHRASAGVKFAEAHPALLCTSLSADNVMQITGLACVCVVKKTHRRRARRGSPTPRVKKRMRLPFGIKHRFAASPSPHDPWPQRCSDDGRRAVPRGVRSHLDRPKGFALQQNRIALIPQKGRREAPWCSKQAAKAIDPPRLLRPAQRTAMRHSRPSAINSRRLIVSPVPLLCLIS